MSASRVILNSRVRDVTGDWSEWRSVWLLADHPNTWRIWSWREPFARLVHKQALGERVMPL